MRVLYQKRKGRQGSETDFHNFFRDFSLGSVSSEEKRHGNEAHDDRPVVHSEVPIMMHAAADMKMVVSERVMMMKSSMPIVSDIFLSLSSPMGIKCQKNSQGCYGTPIGTMRLAYLP